MMLTFVYILSSYVTIGLLLSIYVHVTEQTASFYLACGKLFDEKIEYLVRRSAERMGTIDENDILEAIRLAKSWRSITITLHVNLAIVTQWPMLFIKGLIK